MPAAERCAAGNDSMISELPDIPTGEKDGHRVILPAETFDVKKNTENPELYCIFPYRLLPDCKRPDLQLACGGTPLKPV